MAVRTLIAASASFWIGVALSVGDFHVPQVGANALLFLGLLGYLYVLLTWKPVFEFVSRAKKGSPVWSLLGASVLGAIVFGAAWLLLFQPKPIWSVIRVEPTEFVLHTGQMSNTTQITVTNTGDAVLYGVQVKIWSPTHGAPDAMIVEPVLDPNSIKGRTGPAVVDWDVFMIGFIRESDKQEARILQFYQIRPNQPRVITVKGGLATSSKAFVEVERADAQPPSVLTGPIPR